MASSGKPTAVHFALIFFVMLSVILGVVAYMFSSDNSKSIADHQERKKELDTANAAVKTRNREIQDIKSLVGYDNLEVGELDDPDASKLLGAMRRDIQVYGSRTASQGSMTYSAALLDLSERLNRHNRGEAEKQAVINRKDYEFQQLRQNDQTTMATFKKAADDAQTELQDVKREKEESLAAKDQEISTLRNDLSQSRQDLTKEKEEHSRDVEDRDEEIRKLVDANDRLNEKLASATRQSFEVPDGYIQVVDHNTQLVWLNLGDGDGLQTGTTFSVYTKDNQGVGRDPEDIKGSIKVTRILGAHLAQARILRNDTNRPITKADPIYSPLWSPGRVEQFALVGEIDVDGDGKSDRDDLKDLVAAVGATIDNEVDDEGNRTGSGISVQTKFLVVGKLPNIAEIKDPAKRNIAQQIVQHHSEMEKEARFNGVRKIRLNDFLDYIGYRPQRRLWRPGEEYNLDRPQRVNSGSVTGVYSSRVGEPSDGGSSDGYRGQ